MSLPLAAVSRLPAPGDNVAIAIRRLEAGEVLAFAGGDRALPHTVLEGHRFAVAPIAAGAPLLSWGYPFGRALAPLAPGDYVANASMLQALRVRQVAGARLPEQANFADVLEPYQFEEATFRPGAPLAPAAEPRTFAGYRRPGRRGVGTRNVIAIVGTSSRAASYVRLLAERLRPLARVHPELDGIVPIAHTEGGDREEPNNAPEILRALAGFLVHPNVGAVLAVDLGVEPVNNARLERFARAEDYPLDEVRHGFLTLGRGLMADLAEGERRIREWLPAVAAERRTPEPLSGLRIALQCGGSDAFSGVSGNPLAGALVHEAIRHGATGVLTETDETMGGESHLLGNVRDAATARAFLAMLDRFRDKMAWHGLTAESNPSAGNRFRGLYNIALKSLGAVHKKDPRSRLDTLIEYAQPLRDLSAPGFTFMNGPGNDLEGIAGQVGAGCNLILFVTGNGSITNFPFVPTLKITTTTRRHELLRNEMDLNAGRYLDGEPMAAVVADGFEQLLATAGGARTQGERAGHAQVSLWRNWRQTDTSRLAALRARTPPDGRPLAVTPTCAPRPTPPALAVFRRADGRHATERVGLVLPTSLCSTQIARLAAERLNARAAGRAAGVTRFLGFTHTEGCGFGGETMYELLHRTYRGYLTHPNVAVALLLEHGCEKVPNDVMRHHLAAAGVDPAGFGWASVQLDGGIERVLARIDAWFDERLAALPPAAPVTGGPGCLRLALQSAGAADPATAQALAAVAATVLAAGGSVLLPASDPLLAPGVFRTLVLGTVAPRPTLAYGEPLVREGLHVVATESSHWTENLTGLGGCGAHLALTLVQEHARQGHPLLPVLQVAGPGVLPAAAAAEIDAELTGNPTVDADALLALVARVADRRQTPVANAQGNVDFQLTRGELGLTT